MDAGTITAITASAVTVMGTMGGGVAWLFKRLDNKLSARLGLMERNYARLKHAFQLVANELYRLDPGNKILLRAHELLAFDYGDPVFGDDIGGTSAAAMTAQLDAAGGTK